MTALYDVIGAEYPSTRRADPEIVDSLNGFLQLSNTRSFLDIGCGTGNYTRALAARGGAWTGLDASKIMLDQAKLEPSSVNWVLGDANRLPFADAAFDGVVSTLAIHHFPDLYQPFSEVRRVMSGGAFVLFTAFAEQLRDYWLCHYFPTMLERSVRMMPSRHVVTAALRSVGFRSINVVPFTVGERLQDLFLYSGKLRPQLYLDAQVRANISSFATLCDPSELTSGTQALASDLKTGTFANVASKYQSRNGDYAFVIAQIDVQ